MLFSPSLVLRRNGHRVAMGYETAAAARDVDGPGKLGSGRLFEKQALAKCGPGRLNVAIFLPVCERECLQTSMQLQENSPKKFALYTYVYKLELKSYFWNISDKFV